MPKNVIHITELHNNNYNFFEVLDKLCYKNINHDFTFTDISAVWNTYKQTDLSKTSYLFVYISAKFKLGTQLLRS